MGTEHQRERKHMASGQALKRDACSEIAIFGRLTKADNTLTRNDVRSQPGAAGPPCLGHSRPGGARNSWKEYKSDLSRELARYILTLGFDEEDQNRMSELAHKNQEGSLSSDEKAELENFVKAGHLLALLHSKARKTLKKTSKVS